MRKVQLITGGTILGLGVFGSVMLCGPSQLQANPPTPPTKLDLWGTVRDFLPSPAHPDFNVTPSNGYGPYCGNVSASLDAEGKPVFTGNGWRVKKEAKDNEPV